MHNLYPRLALWLLTLIELLLVTCDGLLILFSQRNSPARGQPKVLSSMERGFGRLARRKRLSVLLVGLTVIVIRVALIPILGVPQPGAHDEFSYLLAADTFAHGKLTNPTHPMWIHFESFHIIHQPTYMSMYPPAQGLVLAAGQLLGHPWTGQMLVTALMCSTLCWMLQGWLPPTWALLGTAIAVLRLAVLSYWMNGYWSASIVALAGALVLGSWPRLQRRLRVSQALLMGLGLVILANSRPYEGLLFSLPVGAAMLLWITGNHRPEFKRFFYRVALPLILVLACGALATGYYNRQVTGNPFRMPYQVNRDTYAMAPYFIWQTPHLELTYNHAVMRDFYGSELADFERNRALLGYLRRSAGKLIFWWQFYLGPLLTIPLLAFPWVMRQRKMGLPFLICAAMVAAFALQTWTLPHYFAPTTGALYILLVQGMRHLWHWSAKRRAVGQALVRAIPALACAMILLRVTAVLTHTPIEPAWPRGNLKRAALLHRLQQLPGQQLVIVSYGSDHDVGLECVYNDADIDSSKVIWARDMGNVENRELLRYFKDRHFWRIDADSFPPKLEPYEAGQ